MKINILFVIDNLQFGGGERVFSQLINGLHPDKYNIFLASMPGTQFYESIDINKIHCIPLDFSKIFNPILVLKLARIIKRYDIKIVNGQGTRAEFYARLAKRYSGKSRYVSTIAMPVEGFDVETVHKFIYRFFDKFSEIFVDNFIVVSNALIKFLITKRRLPSSRIHRIYNGIELKYYTPSSINKNNLRNELKINSDIIVIGAIGRLVWQKGFEYFIQSIPEVIKHYPNSKVLIVGEGPLEDRLKAQGSRLKVQNNLIFTGFRDDIKEVLSSIDILVIPSLLEGFPMITLEGMAMAKPIIATSISGIKEQIIDEESGVLVPPGDHETLTKALIALLIDKKKSRYLGLNARRRVKKYFGVEKMVAETERVYQSLFVSRT